MSKFGMQVAGKTVYGIKTPDKALELVEMVVKQYFGEYWTQHKPRCPLCDSGLSDTEKHMNRPVGECTNITCDSTIHISDFMGKIKDVLGEWNLTRDTWMEEALEELKTKARKEARVTPTTEDIMYDDDIEMVDEETIFVW